MTSCMCQKVPKLDFSRTLIQDEGKVTNLFLFNWSCIPLSRSLSQLGKYDKYDTYTKYIPSHEKDLKKKENCCNISHVERVDTLREQRTEFKM